MTSLQDILYVHDELNLYLVENRLKPAATICPALKNPVLSAYVTHTEEVKNGVRHITVKPQKSLVGFLEGHLRGKNVKYEERENRNFSEEYDLSGKLAAKRLIINTDMYIAGNEADLERLLNAKSKTETGLAYGYPKEAVEAFGTVIDGEVRNGLYITVSLAKARQSGLELPTWLAYLSYVPEQLDIVNGNVSQTSKALGETYQQYVRAGNPSLAHRIEKEFLNRPLPDNWELTAQKEYTVAFGTWPAR